MLKFKDLRESDLEDICRYEQEAFGNQQPWTLTQYKDFISNYPDTLYFKITRKGKEFVGWSFGKFVNKEDVHLYGYAVIHKFKGEGIGKMMVKKFVKWAKKKKAKKVTALARTDNDVSLHIFKKNGFKIMKTVYGAYKNEPGYSLELDLT